MDLIPIMEVALPGYNLENCTEEQKAFSSRYESLKIAHKGEVDPDTEVPQVFKYYHNLGYAPGFFVSNTWDIVNIGGFVGQYSRASTFEAPFFTTDEFFYYWTKCKFFLFYQDAQ